MPNTFPVVDNVPIVRYIKDKSARLGYADVLPTAAITKGQEGQEITEIGFLRDAGASSLSLKTENPSPTAAFCAKL